MKCVRDLHDKIVISLRPISGPWGKPGACNGFINKINRYQCILILPVVVVVVAATHRYPKQKQGNTAPHSSLINSVGSRVHFEGIDSINAWNGTNSCKCSRAYMQLFFSVAEKMAVEENFRRLIKLCVMQEVRMSLLHALRRQISSQWNITVFCIGNWNSYRYLWMESPQQPSSEWLSYRRSMAAFKMKIAFFAIQ